MFIFSAKHPRQRPRKLKSSRAQKFFRKRICRPAVRHNRPSNRLLEKSIKQPLSRSFIFRNPRPQMIRERSVPPERISFHSTRVPDSIRKTRLLCIHRSQNTAAIRTERFAIRFQNKFKQRRRHRFPICCFRSAPQIDRKSTRLNSSHSQISYAVFCLKKKIQ